MSENWQAEFCGLWKYRADCCTEAKKPREVPDDIRGLGEQVVADYLNSTPAEIHEAQFHEQMAIDLVWDHLTEASQATGDPTQFLTLWSTSKVAACEALHAKLTASE